MPGKRTRITNDHQFSAPTQGQMWRTQIKGCIGLIENHVAVAKILSSAELKLLCQSTIHPKGLCKRLFIRQLITLRKRLRRLLPVCIDVIGIKRFVNAVLKDMLCLHDLLVAGIAGSPDVEFHKWSFDEPTKHIPIFEGGSWYHIEIVMV